ncbi:hypothetical protein H4R19_005163, partial [Coemansia spiralis]
APLNISLCPPPLMETAINTGGPIDYFALVDARGDSPLPPAEIEAGLDVALTRTAELAADAPRYLPVLLQRFIYTDRDRCSPLATATALAILRPLGYHAGCSAEMATGPALDGLFHFVREPLETPSAGSLASDIRDEALTCVANAMYLHPECRDHVAQRHCLDALGTALDAAGDAPVTAFLAARCLLFALSTEEGARCGVDELGLQDRLARVAEIHLRSAAMGEGIGSRFMPQQVLAEILKASMSLCAVYLRWMRGQPDAQGEQPPADDSFPPETAPRFARLLQATLDVVRTLPLSSCHLTPSAAQAVAIAMNFSTTQPPEIAQLWLPSGDPWQYVDPIYSRFAEVVDHLMEGAVGSDAASRLADAAEKYQNELTPLSLLLARLVTENPRVRERIFSKVYPDNTIDYTVLPEERPGMSAKLVRIMKLPQGGMLSSAAGDVLLALMGHDIKHFVLAVGYGNAAGYMVARGIPIPQDIVDQVRSSVGAPSAVDPVTGRCLDRADVERELAAMTDEEKEAEAERLFVLFERLNKTGVIKVANPVRLAAESGRFKELDDSRP